MTTETLAPAARDYVQPSDHFADRIAEVLKAGACEPLQAALIRGLVIDAYFLGATHGLDVGHRGACGLR